MTKKDHIAIGRILKELQGLDNNSLDHERLLNKLVNLFKKDNPTFNEELYRDYVRGSVGPNGGKLK